MMHFRLTILSSSKLYKVISLAHLKPMFLCTNNVPIMQTICSVNQLVGFYMIEGMEVFFPSPYVMKRCRSKFFHSFLNISKDIIEVLSCPNFASNVMLSKFKEINWLLFPHNPSDLILPNSLDVKKGNLKMMHQKPL